MNEVSVVFNNCLYDMHRCSSFAEPKRTKNKPSVLIEFQLIRYYWIYIHVGIRNKPYMHGRNKSALCNTYNKVTLFILRVLFYIIFSRTTIPDRYPYFMRLVSPHDVLSRSRSTRGHNKFISSLAPAAAMGSQTNCPLPSYHNAVEHTCSECSCVWLCVVHVWACTWLSKPPLHISGTLYYIT